MHYTLNASNESLQKICDKEWLETNQLGDYASTTLSSINTRKYHSLLTVQVAQPNGRYNLLSSIEDAVLTPHAVHELSSREHPNTIHPNGYTNLISSTITNNPKSVYKVGNLQLSREYMLSHRQHMTIMKYTLHGETQTQHTLRLRPLIAFRNIHSLTYANEEFSQEIHHLENGIALTPYPDLPTLFIQISTPYAFSYNPSWYKNIEYHVEKERGYPYSEDLFMPGDITIALEHHKSVILTVSTFPIDSTTQHNDLWNEELAYRQSKQEEEKDTPLSILKGVSNCFFSESGTNDAYIVAGYHWFDSWGRDTCISLPGLAFCTDNLSWGLRVLKTISTSLQNGIVPNIFGDTHQKHALNSIDASLWYIWAVQQLFLIIPEQKDWIYEHCWESIKTVIETYRTPEKSECIIDSSGLISVGTTKTQLTWMDASIHGTPVTPRNGYPVEINALWYNALAFAGYFAKLHNEPFESYFAQLPSMQQAFEERFFITGPLCYLGDVWNEGILDKALRPNQIFALSLPFSILDKSYHAEILRTITTTLLTPYGLRTLAPSDSKYHPLCKGSQEQRDQAYHQGTVWPWLLGAYIDALISSATFPEAAVEQVLFFLTPLFTQHITSSGIGYISEIFDGNPPHIHRGCIAQAWSIGECIRFLYRVKKEFPSLYLRWENHVSDYYTDQKRL